MSSVVLDRECRICAWASFTSAPAIFSQVACEVRRHVLRSARERPADPIELLLAELMAGSLCPPESVPRNRSGGRGREAVVTRFRAEHSRPGRRPETTKSPQANAGLLRPDRGPGSRKA